KLKLKDYEPWSDVVCGILEHAGFASPCTRAPSSASGDRDTDEIEKLVDILAALKGELRFPEIIDLCREHSLFARLVGEDDDDLDRGKKNIFSRILSKFDGRIFAAGTTFRVQRRSKNVSVFYAERTT